jgi:Mg2+ and Co2+ transporter CorA
MNDNFTLHQTNRLMQGNMSTLQQMTSQIQLQEETMTELARHGQRESKTLKILAVIATIYLPASLIAVS